MICELCRKETDILQEVVVNQRTRRVCPECYSFVTNYQENDKEDD